jgi:tetratricopeptide (TPR) repeat protein
MQALAIDPFKIPYREALRDINSKASGGLLQSWFGSINVLAIKSKLHLARSSGNWRKVLEHGEEILARYPADVDAHTEMAYAAKQLGSLDLAVWLCRKGVDQAPASAPMLRAAALAHEDRKEWKVAAELWERVRRADPYDANAVHKINVLLAEEHIAQQRAQHESTRQPVEET